MKKNSGFTLIELLVSISIIAILTVLASISFTRAQRDGRDQRRISDLKSIQTAAEQYYLLSGNYPDVANYRLGASAWTINGQTVLNKFPNDPKGVGVTYSVVNTNANGYCVCATVENNKNSNAENQQCSFDNPGVSSYYCVKNQQ